MDKSPEIFAPIVVECYSGYKGDEAPRKFIYKGNEYVVDEVLERWYEEDLDSKGTLRENFKVRVSNKEYILKHNLSGDFWEIRL
jgi:hypothetical protein